jgi:ribosomal-protein-alanine N-acetyltransferase
MDEIVRPGAAVIAPTSVVLTQRLRLRPVIAEDSPWLHDACFGDPDVMRYWDLSPSRDAKQTASRIKHSLSIDSAWHATWVIALKEQERPIGMMSYNHRDPTARRLEVGFALARSYWGHGYMTEAMRRFLKHCFDELATHRVEALVDCRNQDSIRFTEKLGFRNEGLLRDRIRVAGEYRSLLMLALLEDEWKSRIMGTHAQTSEHRRC